MLPLSKNGIATVGAIVFILTWGEFIYATTFLTEGLPVSGLLAQQVSLYSVSWNRHDGPGGADVAAAAAVFLIAQKRLVQGLSGRRVQMTDRPPARPTARYGADATEQPCTA